MNETTILPEGAITARIELDNNGFRYAYEFDAPGMAKTILFAQAIYDMKNAMAVKPPRRLADLENSGMMDYRVKALAYLLRRVNPDGTLQPYTGRRYYDETMLFIEGLRGSAMETLDMIERDFFSKRGIVDFELALRSMALLKDIAPASVQDQPQKSASAETMRSDSETPDSTNQESSSDE